MWNRDYFSWHSKCYKICPLSIFSTILYTHTSIIFCKRCKRMNSVKYNYVTRCWLLFCQFFLKSQNVLFGQKLAKRNIYIYILKTRNSQCINTKFKIKMKNILLLTAIHIRKNENENLHDLDLNHWFWVMWKLHFKINFY